MSLLERLSLTERHKYIDSHCRDFPALSHPCLAHAPQDIVKMTDLLRQRAGLTVISGNDHNWTFLATALGDALPRIDGQHRRTAGIDYHTPINFVPLESLYYLDEALDLSRIRQAVRSIWPRLMTSGAPLLILNRIWSAVPEIRDDILRRANDRHVILADKDTPSLIDLKSKISTPIHTLTLSLAKSVPGGIRIDFRRLTRGKAPNGEWR